MNVTAEHLNGTRFVEPRIAEKKGRRIVIDPEDWFWGGKPTLAEAEDFGRGQYYDFFISEDREFPDSCHASTVEDYTIGLASSADYPAHTALFDLPLPQKPDSIGNRDFIIDKRSIRKRKIYPNTTERKVTLKKRPDSHTGIGHEVGWKRPPRRSGERQRSHGVQGIVDGMADALVEGFFSPVKPPRTRRFKIV